MDTSGAGRLIRALIARDLRRAIGGAAWLPVGFFLVVATLVPFAVGPDPRLLERIAAGGLWIAALTAALLPIERLVEPDRANGVLDQLTIRGISEEAIAAAKITAHWLGFGPLLLLAALPSSFILGIAPDALWRAMVALAVGSLGLAALAVMVAALRAGEQQEQIEARLGAVVPAAQLPEEPALAQLPIDPLIAGESLHTAPPDEAPHQQTQWDAVASSQAADASMPRKGAA